MPTLGIRLLGEFAIVVDGIPLTSINQPRLQSLLAYLLLHRHAPQSRRHTAFRLWPDSSEAQALTNLRKALLFLRRALPEADRFLAANAKVIGWRPEAPYTLDVAEFEAALAGLTPLADDRAMAALQAAASHYQGNLLPDCYDEWIGPKREELRERYLQVLERLCFLLEERRDYAAAVEMGQRLLRNDRLREASHRRLMRLHALAGDRAAALHTYQACVTVLRDELGVEPEPETQAAYQRLLRQTLPGAAPDSSDRPPTATAADPRFVGRRAEWRRLQATWRAAAQGGAQVALITGEAGIGKSRLAAELLDWAARQGIATATARAYAAEGRLAYAAVIDWLRTPALWSGITRLEAPWLTELARLVPEVLRERRDLPPPNPAAGSWQRHRLFEAMARAVLASAQPLLLVLDDLQWCDQETLEWLHFFLRFAPQAPVLVVGTARPEEVGPQHPLAALGLALRAERRWMELQLAPLATAETAALAQQMAGAALDPDLAARLHAEAEGNPLFVVEMVRDRLQTGEARAEQPSTPSQAPGEPAAAFTLSARAQAVIESRLAQLSARARSLAEAAAVIGRAFTLEVLVRAAGTSDDDLVTGLDELWQRRIVREQGANAYDFSHDRIREVVYGQVSAARRRRLHGRVAQALEALRASDLGAVSGQIAAHYDGAGRPEQAIAYYQQAAQAALRVFANHEAIGHFNRALALLAGLAESADRDRRELALRLGLGPALIATTGYGSRQGYEAYARAQMLAQRLGDPPNPVAMRAQAIYCNARRDYAQAYALGERLLTLAQNGSAGTDPVLLVEGHYVCGVAAFWQGEFLRSQDHLERAIAGYDVERHAVHVASYSQDPGVVCLSRLAMIRWHLGYADQARQHCDQALALARRLAHPYSLALALAFATWLYYDCRDDAAVARLAAQTVDLSRQHGFPYWLPVGLVFRGYVLAEQGEAEAGLSEILAGMDNDREIHDEVHRPKFLGVLAMAYARAGRVEQGLATLDEALATVAYHGDRFVEAELVQLKGELLDQAGAAPSVAQGLYERASALARQQQARSLELRAAVSLGRLWQRQGKREQACELVASAYAWFTEGFDTADLRAARRLLDEPS